MRRVREVIVVEGRYDRGAVARAVDGTIIETSGFGVFSDGEKLSLLRRLAERRGLIILTDSDKAGFFIRGRLRGMIDGANVKHAYIPDVIGRERRKATPSSEGKLGVEAMTKEIIIEALERSGATFDDNPEQSTKTTQITKADLYAAGLTGSEHSATRRRDLKRRLDLPDNLSTNNLLDILNALYTREEFELLGFRI